MFKARYKCLVIINAMPQAILISFRDNYNGTFLTHYSLLIPLFREKFNKQLHNLKYNSNDD